MQSQNSEQARRGGHNRLSKRAEAIQGFVCHSCGHVFAPEDGDPRELPLFDDCEGQCVVTAALICADRPGDQEDDDDDDAPQLERDRRVPNF